MTRTTLLHNPRAGRQRASAGDLIRRLEGHGHQVRYQVMDGAGWKGALEDPGELVVVAGGDGTVQQVALGLRRSGVPMAIIPAGTANNVALSLGIGGDPLGLVDGLAEARSVWIDLGVVRGLGEGAWFVESVGGGLFAETILVAESEAPPEAAARDLRRDLRLVETTLAALAPSPFEVTADGENLSGEYLVVEAMNMPAIGPNIRLAPSADPSDSLLDLVLVGEEEEHALVDMLSSNRTGEVGYAVRKARTVRFESSTACYHLDDRVETCRRGGEVVAVEATMEPAAVEVLIPVPVRAG